MPQPFRSGLTPLLQRLFHSRGLFPWQGKLLLVLLIGLYLVAVPVIESRWGVKLPGIFLPTSDPPVANSPPDHQERPAASVGAVGVDKQLAGYLEQTGPSTFVSPAGLVYTRGSQQGHRIQHLMAHAKDVPERPGQHGVFRSNDSLTVVQLVDEAYRLALRDDRTRRRVEGERIIYTVDMGRPIGYVGGQSGARRRHPEARHLRLIVERNLFITAFPLIP
jgi:hypothetical protein